MKSIIYIDRLTGKKEDEKVYGEKALRFLYGNGIFSRCFGAPLAFLLAVIPFFSALYGFFQKTTRSKRKIAPFIKEFHLDSSEFQDPPSSFNSFNDFFIRHLKASARPIVSAKEVAIIPADGRYYFYQNIATSEGFIVKGQKFSLSSLLEDEELASQYANGSMMMARLCPTDYHRYHFPCDAIPDQTRLINGWLYSVNPIAVKRNIKIFTQNKRTICKLKSEVFGQILFLEIGATNVGCIHQTYTPHQLCLKGSEKGYFSFGASALIVLFLPHRIIFDQELIAATQQELEIRCLMGQSMGRSPLF